jgi:hypothetical protein
MQHKVTASVFLSACLVIGSAAIAIAARPDSPSVGCPEGGATLSLTIWKSNSPGASDATGIRRMQVANDCAEYALVWYASDPAVGIDSSLLVAPGATDTLVADDFAALRWTAVNTAWQLWIDVEPGALGDHAYCDFITGDQNVPNPQWELLANGSLVPFSCA